MTAVLAPDEEESYLLSILDGVDGIDLAEFCWVDEEQDFGCFRAWDFQWPWYTCEDVLQIDQCGRSLGKSNGIAMRAFAFPFSWPGQDMLITAPELNHLRPLTDLIEQKITMSRLSNEMLPKTKGHGIARQPHWQARFANGSRIISRLPNKDGRGVKGCLAAGTLITTIDGQVPIEDVQVGDLVLTHENRWRPVEQTYRYENPAAVMVAGGGHRGLVMSQSHAMLARRNRNPQRTRKLDESEWIEPGTNDEVLRWYLGTPLTFPAQMVPERLDSPAMMWVVGRYVADGFLSKSRHGHHNRLHVITDEARHQGVRERMVSAGLRPSGHQRAHNATWDIEISDTELCALVLEHFGQHADGKLLPSWLLGAPPSLQHAFLDGYLSGDGHRDDAKERWTAGTASKRLAVGLRLLGNALGYGTSLSWVDPKVTHVMGKELIKAPMRSWRVTITDTPRAIVEDDVAWAKVRRVEAVEVDAVYDIAVAEDASYIADGLISHNQHPLVLEADEMQDYPRGGWMNLLECLKRGSKGAQWRCHGVSRGVRDKYYDFTQDASEFTVHRYTAQFRPSWSDDERKEKIENYGGSRQNPEYKRNIYGEHGDATNPVFVIANLMACVDKDDASYYNTAVYANIHIEQEQLMDGQSLSYFLDQIPGTHLTNWSQIVSDVSDSEDGSGRRRGPREVGATKGYAAYYGGMDVGMTNHPSEILIFGQRVGTDQMDLLTRVHLQRINTEQQVQIVEFLYEFYGKRLMGFGIDRTGIGYSVWDILDKRPEYKGRVWGYNFSEKVPVGFEDREPTGSETQEDLVVMRNFVEHSTDVLRRDYVDPRRMLLPYDRELLTEWQGQTYAEVPSGSPYGKRDYARGKFHTLDAGKCMAGAKTIPPILDQMNVVSAQPPVLDVFFGV